MNRELWDRLCPILAALGAVVGGLVSIPLYGSGQYILFGWSPWGDWIYGLYVLPFLPAVGTFLACACTHPAPRGWPFVRSGAALVAYFGWASAILGYGNLQYFPRYVSWEQLVLGFSWAFGLSGSLAFGVAWLEHRRAIREPMAVSQPARRALLRDILVYHGLALAYGIVAIPQVVFLASRSAPYVLLFLPAPLAIFGVGSLHLFRAAVTADPVRAFRRIIAGAAFHVFPLFLILTFAVYGLLYSVLPGRYTFQDPYYGSVVTDPSLAITPFLGFGTAAFFVYLLRAHLRTLRHSRPTTVATS